MTHTKQITIALARRFHLIEQKLSSLIVIPPIKK